MPNFTQIETRTISGKGVLRIPAEHLTDRAFILYFDVIRKAKNEYLNLTYNPHKSFYARISFLKLDYVIRDMHIEYERQRLDFVADINSESLLAVKCSYKGVLASFANLGNALGLTVVSVEDKINDYQSLKLNWDEVRVSCYSNVGIKLTLHSLKPDTCGELPNAPPPAEPPPPKPQQVPSDTPVDVSDPYDPGTMDDGNTQPLAIDKKRDPNAFPIGDACQRYSVVISWVSSYAPNSGTGTFQLYAPITAVSAAVDIGPLHTGAVQVNCRGLANPESGGGCGEQRVITLITVGGLTSAKLESATPL